jgi:hypothetical protein
MSLFIFAYIYISTEVRIQGNVIRVFKIRCTFSNCQGGKCWHPAPKNTDRCWVGAEVPGVPNLHFSPWQKSVLVKSKGFGMITSSVDYCHTGRRTFIPFLNTIVMVIANTECVICIIYKQHGSLNSSFLLFVTIKWSHDKKKKKNWFECTRMYVLGTRPRL